jgi:hypothetical protein
MNTKRTAAIVGILFCLAASQADQVVPEARTQAPSQPAPLSYRDADSGIILVVESDRHHVVAVDKDGKILWSRQPATDGNLPPYSKKNPKPSLQLYGLAH